MIINFLIKIKYILGRLVIKYKSLKGIFLSTEDLFYLKKDDKVLISLIDYFSGTSTSFKGVITQTPDFSNNKHAIFSNNQFILKHSHDSSIEITFDLRSYEYGAYRIFLNL